MQVLKGINPGDVVVTSSQFLIDSESNLNAALNTMTLPDTTANTNPPLKNNSSENKSEDKTKKEESKKDDMSGMQMNGNHSSPIAYKGVIDVASIDDNMDGKVYQCPMDFNVLSDKPGVDPKCGMKLQEVTIQQAEKNLTEHGFKVK